MATAFLNCGALIYLDEVDLPLLEGVSWHIYPIKPSLYPSVARKEMRHGRRHRLSLHREVAIRIRPDLIGKRFWVRPSNGDYLDCRRENLEVRIAKRRGRPPIDARPIGHQERVVKRPRFNLPPASPSWAGGIVWERPHANRLVPYAGGQPIDRGAVVPGHGPGGAEPDRDSG